MGWLLKNQEQRCLALPWELEQRPIIHHPLIDQPAGTHKLLWERSLLRRCLVSEDLCGVAHPAGQGVAWRPTLILSLWWGQSYSFPWKDSRVQGFEPVHDSWLTATQRDQKLVCLSPHTGLLLLKSFLQLFLMANEMAMRHKRRKKKILTAKVSVTREKKPRQHHIRLVPPTWEDRTGSVGWECYPHTGKNSQGASPKALKWICKNMIFKIQ